MKRGNAVTVVIERWIKLDSDYAWDDALKVALCTIQAVSEIRGTVTAIGIRFEQPVSSGARALPAGSRPRAREEGSV